MFEQFICNKNWRLICLDDAINFYSSAPPLLNIVITALSFHFSLQIPTADELSINWDTRLCNMI